jgi:hypothetical protein
VAALHRDQPGGDQLAHVMREQGLPDVKQGDELALADVLVAAAQHVEDLNPDRLAERLGDHGQTLRIQHGVKAHRRSAARFCGRSGAGERKGKPSYQCLLVQHRE